MRNIGLLVLLVVSGPAPAQSLCRTYFQQLTDRFRAAVLTRKAEVDSAAPFLPAIVLRDGKPVALMRNDHGVFEAQPATTDETAGALLAYAVADRARHAAGAATALTPSHLVHTRGTVPSEEAPLKAFLKDPSHWTPERQVVQQKLLDDAFEPMKQVSKIIGTGQQPVLILTRGNSGSGKSYTLAHPTSPELKNLKLDEIAADPALARGIINPDDFKSSLQNGAEKGQVSSSQVHEEGSMLAERNIDRALENGLSFIVDKRFGTVASFEKLAQRAKARGYRVVMLDVDAPLYDSQGRIAARKPGGGSPNVSLAPIVAGFVDARSHRAAVAAAPSVDDYFLFGFDSNDVSASGLIAKRVGHSPLVIAQPQAFHRLTAPPTPTEIAAANARYSGVLNALSQANPQALSKAGAEPDMNAAALAVDGLKNSRMGYAGDGGPHVNPGPDWVSTYMKRKEYLPDARPGDVYRLNKPPQEFEVISADNDSITLKSRADGQIQKYSHDAFNRLSKEFLLTAGSLPDFRNQTYVRGMGLLILLRDYRYEVQHYDDTLVAHRRFAGAITDYLEATIPNVGLASEEKAETSNRSAAVRITIKNTDAQTRARLLADPLWKVHVGEGNTLVIDTGEVGRVVPGQVVERIDDRGIGYNPPR